MPRVQIQPGAYIDTVNQKEMNTSLVAALKLQSSSYIQELARGVKYLQVTLLSGTASSTFTLDGSSSNATQAGPRDGFIWTMKRMSISGLTDGANPDIVNLYRGSPDVGVPVWQFNGNNFGYTFGKLDMALLPGQYYSLYGTDIAATGTITLTADVIEVPAEMISKLV
jgi:hypothetical protein